MINSPKQALEVFLIRFNNNKTECAKKLGISRCTMHNWLKKPHSIPLSKAILIEKITNRYITAQDLIPILKEISL